MSNEATTITTKIFNPFPGLRAFHIDESHLFFGREGQTDEVLMKLSEHRFVAVIGPSGSGKSSFVYCGVLPILYGGFITDAGPNWDVIVARPGSNPISNLAEALLEQDPAYQAADDDEQRIKRTILTSLMKSSSLGLVEAIRQVKETTGKNFLVLIDQFEELFRFKSSTTNGQALNESLAFINLLMEAVNNEETAIYVTITMRSDFIGDCAQYAELTSKINDSHYLIPQLTREQKRRAIEGPVAVGGGKITSTLVQRLLNDLGDNPDQLPILQHALMRTYDYWMRYREGDEPLDLKHYEAIGTMKEALSLHANEAYEELNDRQRDICAVLFKTITEKRGENFGIRRPTRLGEIAAIADVSVEEVAAVIEKFRAPGRSLLMPPVGKELAADSMIDISHESLMRIWVRLKNWVDEEAESINMYLRLAEAAALHQAGKGSLWRPPDLQLALNWQIKQKPTLVWGQRYDPAYERTMVFLDNSRKAFEEEQRIKELQARRALRNARITAMVMGGATVISVIILLFAYTEKVRADENAQVAEEKRIEAEKQKEIADKNAEQARINADSARINAARALQQKKLAEIQAERARLAEDSAKAASILAEQRRRAAEKAKELEAKARQIADENKKLAIQQAELARKERYLSLSRALALKATRNFPDPQLKALLAAQGYKYNEQFGGPPFNADVYAGIYSALAEGGFNDITTQSLRGHDQQVYALATGRSTDDYVYTGDSRGKVLAWRIDGEQVIADTLLPARSGTHIINDMAFSADKTQLLLAGDFRQPDGTRYMEILNLNNGKLTEIPGVKGKIKDIEVAAPDNRFFILADGGKNIMEVLPASQQLREFIKPAAKLNDFDISNDGRYMAGAGQDGRIYVWDLQNNNRLVEYPTYPKAVFTAIRFSPNSNYLVAGELDGFIRLFDARLQKQLRIFSDNQARITDVKFSPNGKYMAVSSLNKTISVWNMDNLKDLPYQLTLNAWASSLAFSPDSRYLFGGGFEEGEVKVWPMDIEVMARRLCKLINRSFTRDEWETYVMEITEQDPFDPNTCDITN